MVLEMSNTCVFGTCFARFMSLWCVLHLYCCVLATYLATSYARPIIKDTREGYNITSTSSKKITFIRQKIAHGVVVSVIRGKVSPTTEKFCLIVASVGPHIVNLFLIMYIHQKFGVYHGVCLRT